MCPLAYLAHPFTLLNQYLCLHKPDCQHLVFGCTEKRFSVIYSRASAFQEIAAIIEEGSLIALAQGPSIFHPCIWEREGRALDNNRMFPLANGSLLLVNTQIGDEGTYHCRLPSGTTRAVSVRLTVYSK